MTEAMAWALAEYRRGRRLGAWPREALVAMDDALLSELLTLRPSSRKWTACSDRRDAVVQLMALILRREAEGKAVRWGSRCVHPGVRWRSVSVDRVSGAVSQVGECVGCQVQMERQAPFGTWWTPWRRPAPVAVLFRSGRSVPVYR